MSDITRKHLSDALHIITRERTRTEEAIRVALTDITDSDEGFARRIASLTEGLERDKANLAAIAKSIARVEAEIARMQLTRQTGHDAVDALRKQVKQYDLNEKTIQLALLQLEAGNAQA